jgi:hypothetical protein
VDTIEERVLGPMFERIEKDKESERNRRARKKYGRQKKKRRRDDAPRIKRRA